MFELFKELLCIPTLKDRDILEAVLNRVINDLKLDNTDLYGVWGDNFHPRWQCALFEYVRRKLEKGKLDVS